MKAILATRPPICAAFLRTHFRARSAIAATAAAGGPARAYKEIPRASVLPYLFGLIKYGISMPALQKLLEERITGCAKTHGLLYRDSIPHFSEYVMVLDPHDIELVWRVEGRWPYKADFFSAALKDARKHQNVHGGLLGTEGEEWNALRKPISQLAMPPKKVAEYYMQMNEVAYDLIDILQKQRDSAGIYHNVTDLSFRWALEYVAYFVLGDRLGCLGAEVPEDCKDFIQATIDFEKSFQRSIILSPFRYKFWPTKDFRTMTKTTAILTSFASKHMERKVQEIKEMSTNINEYKESVKVDFLTSLLLSAKLSSWQMTSNVVDMLFGGLGPSSFTQVWALYKLATNPDVQECLRSEVQEVVGSADIVTPDHIAKMPYLKDTIKETLRMYPVGNISFRVLQEDTILSGYKVPAGTLAIMPQLIMGRLPELFPQPEQFMPERWSKENANTPHPFSQLPFGFGPRMCPGRRIAELATYINLALILKKFRLKFPKDAPMDYFMMIALSPKRQMNLVFEDL